MAELTGMQPQHQQSVCGPAVHSPMHTCRPIGLLMVHAVLTMAVKLQMFGLPAYKPTPKALASEFSQKMSAYMRVYMAIEKEQI